MNDGDKLERRIARMGEDIALTGTGARVLAAADADALLRLLLREVEETVLSRTLTVRVAGGAVARIEVAGGRILGLETPAGTVSGRGQFDDVDAFARALGDRLRGFVGAATELHVKTGRMARKPGPGDLRCPADRIPLTAAPAAPGADGLRALVAALRGQAEAWSLVDADGAPVAGDGDTAELARFAETAVDAVLDQMDDMPGGPDAPACLLLGAEGGSGVVCARAGGAVLLVRLKPGAGAEIGPLWQRLFGA